ncbi:MAG: TlpA family protein disulfide reductase [Desulfobulbaceae bacterium]
MTGLSGRKIRAKLLVFGLTCFVIHFCGAGMASSFPFRAIAPGDALPALTFKNSQDNSTVATASLKGSPAALVFWGADMDSKKERSLKTLAAVEESLPFLEQRKIKVLLVNAQGDSQEVIREVAGRLSGKLPVYLDESQKAYGDLGIYVVPSVLLVDTGGKVVAGIGFSHDFTERLQGEVQVMLGEKTREAMEKGLKPEMKEKPAEEKQSMRHLNMALVMVKRGQTDSAISELQKALALEPEMAEAQGQLGCLYLDKGQLAEAKTALDKAYQLNPDYLPATICDARVRAEEGEVAEAVADLQALLFRNARNGDLHYALGTLLEKQQKFTEAAKEYRKAYELVSREIELE